MLLIKLNSDNFDGEYLTTKAYEEVILQMSTGDHATHKTELYTCPKNYAPTHYHLKRGELIEIESDNGVWHPSRATV